MLKRVISSWLLCAVSLCLAFSTHVLAQAEPTSEIGMVTVDHDNAVAPRWVRLDFDPLISGTHTIRLAAEGDADIRFSVFNAQTRSAIDRNLVGQWTGNLDIAESYYLGIWSVSGVADVIAAIEASPIDEGLPGIAIGEGTLDADRVSGPSITQLQFDSQGSALHTISVSWDSGADIRFNVFDSQGTRLSRPVVSGSNPGVWSGNLNADEQYTLRIWSSDGLASYSARVSAENSTQPLTLTTQPANLTVTEGGSATFSVSASGSAELSYQWFVDDIAIDGATSANLNINPVSALDNGARYSVQISDGIDTVLSDSATLTVNPNDEPLTSVVFGQGVLDSDRNVGPSFTRLNFDSFGAALHTISVAWDSDADIRFNVFEPDGTRLNNAVIRGENPGVWSGVLDANQQYSIAIWSSNGIANFTASIDASLALAITNQPADLVVTEGDSATFTVEAVGSGILNYQWFEDGEPLVDETTDTLFIPATSIEDTGKTYTVDVFNQSADTETSEAATLTVEESLSLTERYFQEADTSTWMLNGPAPTLDYRVGPNTDGWGRALLRIGDVLLVGGDFQGLIPTANSANQTDRPWLAALDAVSGQPVTSFTVPQQVNSVVRSLALSPDASQVYVGGDFGLLVLDALTGEFNFEIPVNDGNNPGRIFEILVTESQLYIGGEFSEVIGSPRRNLARLSLLGELDTSWSPQVSGGESRGRSAPVQSLALSPTGNTVYVGGTYTSIDDTQVPITERETTVSMLAISTDDGSVNPERFLPELVLGEFEDSKDLRVHDIAIIDSYIITAWGGPNYLTLHQPDGTRIQQYSGPGDVQAIQVLGDLVIVGHHGEFLGTLTDPIPPQAVLSIEPVVVAPFKLHTFRLDPLTARLVPEQTWPINGTFGVWAIAASDDSIWITGNLRRAGTNNRQVEGLVRFPATE